MSRCKGFNSFNDNSNNRLHKAFHSTVSYRSASAAVNKFCPPAVADVAADAAIAIFKKR